MGDKLAKKIIKEFSDHDIDVVIPIPDTSRTSGWFGFLTCCFSFIGNVVFLIDTISHSFLCVKNE